MSNNKKNNFETFAEKSVTPEPSKTYDGQNLTVMQGVMGRNTMKMLTAQREDEYG